MGGLDPGTKSGGIGATFHRLAMAHRSAFSAQPDFCTARLSTLSNAFRTFDTCCRPPHRVRIPRALGSVAMARRVVWPPWRIAARTRVRPLAKALVVTARPGWGCRASRCLPWRRRGLPCCGGGWPRARLRRRGLCPGRGTPLRSRRDPFGDAPLRHSRPRLQLLVQICQWFGESSLKPPDMITHP